MLLLDDSSEPFKAAGEALRRALPDCRVAVMPGQRHAAMDTATDLFTAQVLSSLRRRTERAELGRAGRARFRADATTLVLDDGAGVS